MKQYTFLLLLFSTIFISCKKDTTNVGVPTQPQIELNNPDFITIDKADYTIKAHKDWIVEKQTSDEIDLYIYLDTQDDFVENINIIKREITPDTADLEKVRRAAINELSQQGKIISTEFINSPTTRYLRLVITARHYQENLKFLQHYILSDSHLYLITLTTLERDFEQYEKAGEQIMQSFTLKK